MKGSDKSLTEPGFPEVQRSLPVTANVHMNGSGSFNSYSNSNNSKTDVMGSTYATSSANTYRYAFSTKVSAASRSDSYTGSSHHSYHHQRWTREPIKGRPNTDDHRHWIYNTTPPPLSSSIGRFIVVSFNILGVDNASQHSRELYWHIPSFIMEWNYRKRRILLELRLWSPDIICLQEVDRFGELQNDLVQQGYEGIYKGRTGGSSDGCAIFWRTKKFVLLQEESIDFQELDLRHNVAQLCVLQFRHEEQERAKGKRPKAMIADNLVVVCNIHVLFNPNRGDIKLGQVRHLLEKAHNLSHEWGGIPVILAGDFNSVPQSPLYQFIQNGVLDVRKYNRRSISGQVEKSLRVRHTRVQRWTSTSQFQVENEGEAMHAQASITSEDCRITEDTCVFEWSTEELEKATGIANESLMKHSLNLQSAYSSIQGSQETRDTNNEPIVTTYHGNFMGTVDYIWFSEGLIPVRILEVLPVSILQRTKGLPSKKWGSDHLALACEFSFSM